MATSHVFFFFFFLPLLGLFSSIPQKVVSVRDHNSDLDRVHHLHTTHSPQFLGLPRPGGLWSRTNMGEGIVICVLDTGVAIGHPSFDDEGMPPPPAKWKGHCEPPIVCNNKLPRVVINCAALSVPRACETDPDAAMGINVPSSLVSWLASFGNGDSLLIHLSTDQVYEGVKSFYKEEDDTVPVNTYGKSKVAAEQFISAKCSNYAILRSSIIYGPQTISPVSKSLPIQWMDNVLSRGHEVEFFHDEFRCPVYVQHVVNVILALTEKWISDGKQLQLLLNVGGPDRLSRVQMAESVATFRGYNNSLIKAVSASSVNRGVVSPADISMDISRLIQVLNIKPVSFEAGVRATLENSGTS